MAPVAFDKVWYSPVINQWRDLTFLSYRDTGQLVVYDAGLQYFGHKGVVNIQGITRVSFGKQGQDGVNDWVKVEYGPGYLALFADGSWLGWGGMLGGTRKIADVVMRLAPRTW